MKPKLSYKQQILHLKEKGIQFNIITEDKALHYLQSNNYLFKLSAYRKNYPKDITNTRYLHLDFSTLVDLAIIDMYLRALLLKMSLNIEHFAKVKLLQRITNSSKEDGYSIVTDYLHTLPPQEIKFIENELSRNAKSPYCSQAYSKYKNHWPAWVFVEIISFGSFIAFYKYCADRFFNQDKETYEAVQAECRAQKVPISTSKKAFLCRQQIKEDRLLISHFYLFLSIKRLRNAAAHNNCILSDLSSKSSKVYKQTDARIIQELKKIGLPELTINHKLSNERISEIISCLYAHKCIVSSSGVNQHLSLELHNFADRLFKHHGYEENELIRTTFNTLSLIIDKWFPIV